MTLSNLQLITFSQNLSGKKYGSPPFNLGSIGQIEVRHLPTVIETEELRLSKVTSSRLKVLVR